MPSLTDRKHILFISSWYPNRNNPLHGIFNRVFAETVAMNHQVSVLHVCSDATLKNDHEIVEYEEENIFTVIIYYKKIQNNIPILSQFLKKQKFIELYEKGYQLILNKIGKPHIIQLNVVLPAGIGAEFLSKKHHIPMVVNECWTGYMPSDGNYKGLATKYFTKKIVSHAKVIMPVSESLKQDMLLHELKGNYQIVPNVVDDAFVKAHSAFQKSVNKTRFIHISTLDQDQKNVIGILNAFEKAYQINNTIELSFIGNLKNASVLKDCIDSKKLNQVVTLKDSMNKELLINELNTHDSLIMFSNYESFCLVIAEAMACGIPVISSKCGGLTNIIPDFAGIKVDTKNEQQLTDAIIEMSENKATYKADEIRAFIANNFSKTVINNQLSTIYQSVLKSSNCSKAF